MRANDNGSTRHACPRPPHAHHAPPIRTGRSTLQVLGRLRGGGAHHRRDPHGLQSAGGTRHRRGVHSQRRHGRAPGDSPGLAAGPVHHGDGSDSRFLGDLHPRLPAGQKAGWRALVGAHVGVCAGAGHHAGRCDLGDVSGFLKSDACCHTALGARISTRAGVGFCQCGLCEQCVWQVQILWALLHARLDHLHQLP